MTDLNHKALTHNSVQCTLCGEILTSKHRHDYVMCKCPNQCFVDGGLAYQRYGAVDLGEVKNLATYKEYSHVDWVALQKLRNEAMGKEFLSMIPELMDYMRKEKS